MNDNTVSYEATVRGRDNNSDIAVLKVDADGLAPAVFGDSDKVEVGDPVVSIGNPYSCLLYTSSQMLFPTRI